MDLTADFLTKSPTSANRKANLCIYALVWSVPVLREGAADNGGWRRESTGGQVLERLLSDVSLAFLRAFDLYITLLNPVIV